MSDEQIAPDPELISLETQLGSLVPSHAKIDRDRVMFLAGQASSRPRISGHRGWMALAASLAIVALGEAAMLRNRPQDRVVEKLVVIREPLEKPVANQTNSAMNTFPSLKTDHERQAWQLVLYGLDGLPALPSTARTETEPHPASSRKFLQDELRKELDLGDAS